MIPDPPVFRTRDGEVWTASMVVGAADFLGLSAPLRAALSSRLAAASYAEEEGFEAEQRTLQEGAEAFRYERGLLTVEETECFFQRWGVRVEDLADFVLRRHWMARFAPDLSEIEKDYAPSREEVDDALWAEAVFDGAARGWIVACARRTAALAEAAGRGAGETPPAKGEVVNPGVDPRELLPRMEECYRRLSGEVLGSLDYARALATKRLDLVRVAYDMAAFSSEKAAREALLCVTEDREPFACVARSAGAAVISESRFVADLGDPLRAILTSAASGEIAGPLEQDGAFVLYRLAAKIEPDLKDESVRRRLERDALDIAFDRLTGAHIVYILHPGEIA